MAVTRFPFCTGCDADIAKSLSKSKALKHAHEHELKIEMEESC